MDKTAEPPADHDVLDMDTVRIDPAWAIRVPASLAMRRQVLAFASVGGQVYVACLDAADRGTLEAVERHVRLPICPRQAEPASLRRALNRVFGNHAGAASATQRSRSAEAGTATDGDGEGAVPICDELMRTAIVRQASDIHIDPDEKEMQVRLRVDGVLEPFRSFPIAVHNGVISRFKVLGGMDIAEKRAPQDGHFTHVFDLAGQGIDVRLATLPTRHGERMTVRLLALQTESLTLERLGMSPVDLAVFADAIAKPHGLILLTGPTGSGKTTTLYAALRRIIAQEPQNIITIEDPIEYAISGVAQVEVDSADKVSFNKALRSVLRHDPDVVMIGEIRDGETADIAIKSSLTGHLVLSTLHTNSAASALTRLADMGVARYLIAATMRLVVAQRLVRRLAPAAASRASLPSARRSRWAIRRRPARRSTIRWAACIAPTAGSWAGWDCSRCCPSMNRSRARLPRGPRRAKSCARSAHGAFPGLWTTRWQKSRAARPRSANVLSAVTVW